VLEGPTDLAERLLALLDQAPITRRGAPENDNTIATKN
jgi:hypothetical protein